MKSKPLNIKYFTKSLQDKFAYDFSCGNPHIDAFIRSEKALDDSYGKTYVYLSDSEDVLIGFYNLGVGYIERTSGVVSYKTGGSVHLNEFALDLKYHNDLVGYDEEGKKLNI